MKPTDEAKRLREEIADIVTDMWCEDPPDEKDMADILINKVLDAAIEGIARVYIDNKLTGPFIIYQDTINKLRP